MSKLTKTGKRCIIRLTELEELVVSLSIPGSARHSHCRGQGFDSPMLHQITKCRTRKHWRTICTSDKLKGQLKGCPLNMPGIMLEGLSLLRNPARMTSTGTLVTSWIRSLIHWHTRINSTLEIRPFFRKSKANIL